MTVKKISATIRILLNNDTIIRKENKMEIKNVIAELLKKNEKIDNIWFIACGGSLAAYYPAKIFLETESKKLRVGYMNSSEFLNSTPKQFGENSILVVTSHRGNTPETVESGKFGKAKGVPVIAVTYNKESPIVEHADYVLTYSFGEDRDVAEEKTMVGLKLALELLNQVEGYSLYDKFLDGISKIDSIVKKAKETVQKNADSFAASHKDDKTIYTMASGAGFGAAHMQSTCILMEMQWINSAALHTGEFFHGPFEIVDDNMPFMLQLSVGSTRPLDERAVRFLDKYAKRVEIIDAEKLGLGAIDSEVVDYFNHSLFNNVYAVYNKKLSEIRNHPLTTRRYMWKVEY